MTRWKEAMGRSGGTPWLPLQEERRQTLISGLKVTRQSLARVCPSQHWLWCLWFWFLLSRFSSCESNTSLCTNNIVYHAIVPSVFWGKFPVTLCMLQFWKHPIFIHFEGKLANWENRALWEKPWLEIRVHFFSVVWYQEGFLMFHDLVSLCCA